MAFPKFEIYTGNDGKFYFRLFAQNGQNILSSQGYVAKSGCRNGIDSVKTNAANADNFEIKESTGGKFFFNLLAANKQIIGSSQMYSSKQTCQNGITSVQRTAPDAPIEES